jgi:hypothetical protein
MRDIVPFVNDFYAAQRKAWTATGGELIGLPADARRIEWQDCQRRRRSVERESGPEQGGQAGV